jgi:hypothetical protein
MKKENFIAIDIVLIPDNKITKICKRINTSCYSKIEKVFLDYVL